MPAVPITPDTAPPKRTVWSITLAAVTCTANASPKSASGCEFPLNSGAATLVELALPSGCDPVRLPATQSAPPAVAATLLCEPGSSSTEAVTL